MSTHKSIEEYAKEFETKFSYGGFGGLMPQHRDGGATLMREVKEYISTALQSYAQQQVQEAVEEIEEQIKSEARYISEKYIDSQTGRVHFLTKITGILSTLKSKRLEE